MFGGPSPVSRRRCRLLVWALYIVYTHDCCAGVVMVLTAAVGNVDVGGCDCGCGCRVRGRYRESVEAKAAAAEAQRQHEEEELARAHARQVAIAAPEAAAAPTGTSQRRASTSAGADYSWVKPRIAGKPWKNQPQKQNQQTTGAEPNVAGAERDSGAPFTLLYEVGQ